MKTHHDTPPPASGAAPKEAPVSGSAPKEASLSGSAPKDTAAHTEIELRAEPAPRTIGDIPPALTRWGFAVILLLMAALILALILIPDPYSSGESILRHILAR